MSDEVVPFAGPARLPAPADLKDMLRRELADHVTRERVERGPVTQPEDVFALVRKLSGAEEVFVEYAHAFRQAAVAARRELEHELVAAVGENDGVPLSGLIVPDANGTDIRFTLDQPNHHDIDEHTVLTAVIWTTIDRMRDGEPAQEQDESDESYDDRYWKWFAHVVERVLDQVFGLGTYAMQVSKVRAYMATLAGEGDDGMAAVLRGAITTTQRYRGVKMERKQRRTR